MDHSPLSTAVLIGGPAAAGKTTVGRLLARKHGMRWYSTDAHAQHHRAIAVARGLHAEDDPAPGTFDRGPLINDDLVRLAAELPEAGIVVEGALITPDLAPLPRSVWLMPSAAEQRRRLVERSGSSDIHHGLLYGHTIVSEQLADTPANVITVDGQTVTETIEAVEVDLASNSPGRAPTCTDRYGSTSRDPLREPDPHRTAHERRQSWSRGRWRSRCDPYLRL